MKRNFSTMLTLMALVLMASAGTAWAQSSGAHFQKNSVNAAIQSNGDLVVSFVEAGLGNGNVTYLATGNVTATYFCVTNAGTIPNAANKTVLQGAESAGGTFQPKNGKVTASLTLVAPTPPESSGPTCPAGQTLSLQSVSWSNVTLTDQTNNVFTTVTAGTFSITLFPAP